MPAEYNYGVKLFHIKDIQIFNTASQRFRKRIISERMILIITMDVIGK